MKKFQPATYRKPARQKPATHVYDYAKQAEETVTLIQGKMPDSKPEWRVAMALYKCGYEFLFQHPVYNGPKLVSVIDYYVLNAGRLPVPLYEHGVEWHISRNQAADEYKMSQVNKILYGRAQKAKVIWEYQALTIPMAMEWVRRILNG